MKSTLKMFGILVAILLGLIVISFVNDSIRKIEKAAKEPNAVDHFIGKTHVDIYLDVKDKSETFNLPAIRTAIKMFQVDAGRYPNSMLELENSESGNSSITRDKKGRLLDLKIIKNQAIITSPGSDKIIGTTDDISHTISL